MHLRRAPFWSPSATSSWLATLLVLTLSAEVSLGQNPAPAGDRAPANGAAPQPAANDAAAKALARELNTQLGEFQRTVQALGADIRRAREVLQRGKICTNGTTGRR